MLPILQVGPLAIQTPGLALILGLWLALEIVTRQAVRHHQRPALAYNTLFFAVLVGLAGARVGHILSVPQAYLAAPLSVFSLQPSAMLPGAGLLAALLFSLWWLHRGDGLNGGMLDALTPSVVVLLAASALSNFLSGNAYGLETSLPWGIALWGVTRHPTQVYEFAAASAILAWLWGMRRFDWPWPGAQFAATTVVYASARLFIEAVRADSWLLPGDIRGAQVAALLAIVAVLGYMAWRTPAEAASEQP